MEKSEKVEVEEEIPIKKKPGRKPKYETKADYIENNRKNAQKRCNEIKIHNALNIKKYLPKEKQVEYERGRKSVIFQYNAKYYDLCKKDE